MSQETESEAQQYEILFTEDAKYEIANLDGSIKSRLKKVLEKKLAADPAGYGLPLRSILTGFLKHEFAEHRIIYQIPPGEKKIVLVCAVGPRKAGDVVDVYNQLEKVAESGKLAAQIRAVLDIALPKRKNQK